MAAFVGALLCHASDRTPWLAARLGDRYDKTGLLVIAATIAIALTNALGAIAGMLMAPIMTPDARALLLALALLSAGISALLRLKPPAALDRGAGPFLTAFLCLLALGLGDRTQFLTMALAARTPIPALAAIGATFGAMAVIIPALVVGERAYRRLPHRAIRIAIGSLLVITGVVVGLGALRLF